MEITVTKTKDTKFNGKHPNGIFEGHTETGKIFEKPTVGKPLLIANKFITSTVTKVNKTNFHTLYSVYSYKIKE